MVINNRVFHKLPNLQDLHEKVSNLCRGMGIKTEAVHECDGACSQVQPKEIVRSTSSAGA